MYSKISERRQFLSERKKSGNRVTIGFAGIADLRSFIAMEYMSGMMKAADDYDINFINMGAAVKYSLFDDINFINNYLKNFKFMKSPFVDGVVTWASSLGDFIGEDKLIELMASLKPLPVVDIGHTEIKGATHLKIDANVAMEDVLAHLIDVHHYSRFVFFGADVSLPHWNRLKFYKEYLKKRNITENEDGVFMAKSMSINHIAEQVDELCKKYDLTKKSSLDAIVCTSDIIACEVMEQLEKRGISVPRDVAVTGFNNWYEGITARSPLTTVDLSYFKRGYAAVEYLIDKMIRPVCKTDFIMFPASLVVRQSCGCFENSVQKAVSKNNVSNDELSYLVEHGSAEEVKRYLITKCQRIFTYENESGVRELVDCFFEDLYENDNSNNMLLWLQKRLQDYRKLNYFDGGAFQSYVSDFRTLVMPFLDSEKDMFKKHIENIFHEMRALISEFQKYEIIASRENPYRISNISEQALSFMEADSINKIFEVLKTQLSIFDIQGAVVALSDNMTYSFPSPVIKFIYPDSNKEYSVSFINKKIVEANMFPKGVFPSEKNYAVILEVLSYADHYFGYAFFLMKTPNIAKYDVLRMLLSNALYKVYKRNEESGVINTTVSKYQIEGLIKKDSGEVKSKSYTRRLSVEKLTSYFIEHIGDKTCIEQIAKDFMVSRSFLSKKTKELTGLSVQALHEKIKIEQAKSMLMSDVYELGQISEKLGFSNQNYFSNVFKKNTGLSPLNWMKKNK